MGDITKGSTLVQDGVTTTSAADFHAMVDDATINSNAVTTAKIADANVTTAKLAAGAVTPAKVTPGAYFSATAGGTADAITATLSPALGSLVDGARVQIIPGADNTDAVTLNVNGLGDKDVKHPDGSALVAGDIKNGYVFEAIYSSTADAWILSTPTKPLKADFSGFDFTGVTNLNPPVKEDQLFIWDESASAPGRASLGNLQTSWTALGETPAADDTVVLYDTSANQIKKVAFSNLVPYEKYIGTAAIPSTGSTATFTHGLSGTPQTVRVVLQCTDAGGDNTWAQGDEIAIEYVRSQYQNNQDVREPQSFLVYADDTEINVVRNSLSYLIANRKSDGSWTAGLTGTKWQLKAYAVYFA
ncbi:MAG: hypothetical protein ACO395_07710 [Pontimonas sp.]